VSKLCATDKKKKVKFQIREITHGSKKKTYGHYIGEMKPIKLKGRVIKYSTDVYLAKKRSTIMIDKKVNKMRGGDVKTTGITSRNDFIINDTNLPLVFVKENFFSKEPYLFFGKKSNKDRNYYEYVVYNTGFFPKKVRFELFDIQSGNIDRNITISEISTENLTILQDYIKDVRKTRRLYCSTIFNVVETELNQLTRTPIYRKRQPTYRKRQSINSNGNGNGNGNENGNGTLTKNERQHTYRKLNKQRIFDSMNKQTYKFKQQTIIERYLHNMYYVLNTMEESKYIFIRDKILKKFNELFDKDDTLTAGKFIEEYLSNTNFAKELINLYEYKIVMSHLQKMYSDDDQKMELYEFIDLRDKMLKKFNKLFDKDNTLTASKFIEEYLQND